ncbi:ribonuclease P protein component [Patescibacteria group bacterium]|nr:ribonuclease P protein component [Patescibacteria group bacterium]
MLPKKHRLPLRTELNRVKKEGTLIQGRLFSLLVNQAVENQPSRFGFIISSKIHKKAVKRNRAKRLLSEVIIDLSPKIKSGFDVVFLAKKKIIEAEIEEIKKEIKRLFAKAGMVS